MNMLMRFHNLYINVPVASLNISFILSLHRDIERLPDPDPDHHGTTDVTTATAEVAIVVTVTDVTMVAVVRGVVKHHLTGVKQHSVINAVVITLIITIVNGNMNQNHLNQHHNSNSKITGLNIIVVLLLIRIVNPL